QAQGRICHVPTRIQTRGGKPGSSARRSAGNHLARVARSLRAATFGQLLRRREMPATIILTDEQVSALLDVFASAQRGRDDFEYLASLDRGDYDASDIARARECHERERDVESAIRNQLDDGTGINLTRLQLEKWA